MPIYVMSIFRLPKGVKSRLEKIQRNFLWEGGNSGRKPHLINWKIVCAEKEGSLGIRNLSTINRALLEKWTWRFSVEENSPWKTVIKQKYCTEAGGWFTNAPRGSYGVGLWKEISKESEQLKNDSSFEIGDGCRIKFWENVWCRETPLRVSFPSLYALSNSKGAMASELWENIGGNGVWNPKFIRGFNDWELECIQIFLGLLNSKKANPQKRDNLVWKVAKNGSLMVKENFTHLERGSRPLVPVKLLWNSCVPTKVSFCT